MRHRSMAKKAKYDWGKSRDGRYQKFETRLAFNTNVTADAQDSAYIDIAQCLSLVNRKLVRQGHVFKVKGMHTYTVDADADNACTTRVSVLPRTWMMFNAYKKARSLWNQMNLEAIDALGSGNLPKYYDFKVYFDREHFDNQHNSDGGAITENLLPVDGDINGIAGGDWVYSKYETSAGTPLEFNVHMLGGHATAAGGLEGSSGRDLPADQGSLGAILAYQQSRGAAFTDQDLSGLDQNVDIDSPWAQLFAGDTQMQEVLTDLDVDNDGPPYPADYAGGLNMPEGNMVQEFSLNDQEFTGHSLRTFEAPLGLIKFDFNTVGYSNDTSNVRVVFDTEIIGSC
jgi:hypothetical protein